MKSSDKIPAVASQKAPIFSFCLYPGTSKQTREKVLEGMKKVQGAFAEHDLLANVRLETYEEERYFHIPPTR